MKIIGLIGYSGSGKTYFICNSIKYLKKELDMKVAVIKNIHEHQIDKEGKDTYKYSQVGAEYAITKNVFDETAIFIKKMIEIEQIIEWISNGPFKVDLIFIEGFRNLIYPTILCVKNYKEIKNQLKDNIKMISGLICKDSELSEEDYQDIPIVDIEKDFKKFILLFDIER
jgi:molybdopterin-guanine dinucleotide biosynthesis protein B